MTLALSSAASTLPADLATAPAFCASLAYSSRSPGVDNAAPAPRSQSTVNASRPCLAAQKCLPSTATPLGTCTTSTTPGIAFAFVASNDLTLPPNTGERAQRDHHVGTLHVHAEFCLAADLGPAVEAPGRLADQHEFARVLQCDLVRHRQLRRRVGELAVAGLALAAEDEALLGAAVRRL